MEGRARVLAKLSRALGPKVINALNAPDVVEIMLNPDGQLWQERLGHPMTVIGEMSPTQAEIVIGTVAYLLHTTATRDKPVVEGELPLDGSRFEGVLPPVASQPVFSIRKRASQRFTLIDYIQQGVLTETQADLLKEAIAKRQNMLVVGGTGSGKTTFVNALLHEISLIHRNHRLVVLEDTPELQVSVENAVILKTTDTVSLQDLVKTTLRLRPDRIVVGEVRGGEALALLKAWNTGHPGGVATIHANHAEAGLHRMAQLIAEVTPTPMHTLIAEAVQLVVFLEQLVSRGLSDSVKRVFGDGWPLSG